MTDEQYDPSAHTVDEVNAYLADADDAEKARVLEAEKAGQNRKTIDGNAEQVTETKATEFSEAAKAVPEAQGEKYQKGYEGYAPSRDGENPVDLTLAGVTGQKDA